MRFKSFALQFAAVLVVWTLIALVSGCAQLAFFHVSGKPLGFIEAFRQPLIEQWIWAALTPVAFWLAGRIPLTRPRLRSAIAAHAAGFLLLSFVHCALAQALDPMTTPAQYHGPAVLLRMLNELYSDIWMYWPLVGIRALVDSHARERERERQTIRLQQSMSDMRLSLLRAQIQPHFLFNTLHGISALLKVDPRAAEDMVSDLAEILRASFRDATSQEISLAREAAVVRCYVRIQQLRIGQRLQVDWQIDDSLGNAVVPALVLQSLVENAVVHGVGGVARHCTLTVGASRHGDSLTLLVSDDGAGTPRAPGSGGMGLRNVRERLEQLYGSKHRFTLISEMGQGTQVTITLPFKLSVLGKDTEHDDSYADRGRRAARSVEPSVAS